MKKIALVMLLALVAVTSAVAQQKSQTVVYIGGSKYYVHSLESTETLASIAELYRVSERSIESSNPNFMSLKAGDNVKVPFLETGAKAESITGLKRLFSFNKHKVAAGETLYAISRKYAISVDVIIEDNPNIDPIHLSIGQVILIRKSMKGKSDEAQSQQEWEEYKSDLNKIAHQEDYSFHIVEKGETIYSLSRKAGMSEAEFIELNNLQDGLKAGSIVKMELVDGATDSDEMSSESDGKQLADSLKSGFAALSPSEQLKVALMLPLSSDGRTNRSFAEFYNGFLLGLDRVKNERGRNIKLSLYNTERSLTAVDGIVSSEEFEGTNLIVGPIYEDMLSPVLNYAEAHNVPVVSPLAKFDSAASGVLFQMAPMSEDKYTKIDDMLHDSKHITLIYTAKLDAEFELDILSMLGGRPYAKHTYVYEHPTEVAKKIQNGRTSPSDLTKIICNGKDNTVIVLSDNETDVDRILSALSSAQINHVARGGEKPTYRVLGSSHWSRYKNIDHTVLFKNNVTLLSSYHANRSNRAVKLFDSKYIKSYGALPTLYAYRGYDAAVIFCEGLFSDIEYNMEGRTFAPLQSGYRFEVEPASGVHVNREWIKVDYNSDYTITVE